MISIDDRIAGDLAEHVKLFRRNALAIESDPEAITRLASGQEVREVGMLGVNRAFNPYPLRIDGKSLYEVSVSLRVRIVEEVAFGDAGLLMAVPGPNLAGAAVEALATPAQAERFFSIYTSTPAWSCFAVTEPTAGTDALEMSSQVESRKHPTLVGQKYLIGNGARACAGVVFAKVASGPLGIRAVLLSNLRRPGVHIRPLATVGLTGAGLAHLSFEDLRIQESDLLGAHLPPTRRGFFGALATFARYRPCVAAMALGTSRAVMELVKERRRELPENRLDEEIIAVRKLLHRAAAEVDLNPKESYLSAVAKYKATRLVEKVTQFAVSALGTRCLYEEPLLNKWYRDARAFEFMEGTSFIHLLNSFSNYTSQKLLRVG